MVVPNGFDPDPRVHNEARSLVSAGYEVTVVCWDRELTHRERELLDGIQIERIFAPSSYGLGSSQLRYIWKFWRKAYDKSLAWRPDVVHAHDFITLPLAFWVGRRLKIPIIFDAHESYHEMLADNVHPFIKFAIARAERLLIKRIDLLITVGRLLEKEYQRRGARKTAVIGNWKRLEDFAFPLADIDAARAQLRIPKDRLVISYVGYLAPSRGLMPLIHAAQANQQVFVVLGGKGILEKNVSATIGEAENILFLGPVPPNQVPLMTAISDVVYYGLENGDGNNRYSAPNKLFEALACGRAILTGNTGEIAKIVKEENCGLNLTHISKENLLSAFETLHNGNLLKEYKYNAHSAGQKVYNWRNAEKILLRAYADIFNHVGSP